MTGRSIGNNIHRMPRDESDGRAALDLLELIRQREEVDEALKFAYAGQGRRWPGLGSDAGL